MGPAVLFRFVIEDVIGDPGLRKRGGVGVMDQHVGGDVGIARGQRQADVAKIAPRPPAQISQSRAGDLPRAGRREGHVEASGQARPDFGVVACFGFLEDKLEGTPGAVDKWDLDDDLEQNRPRGRTAVVP